MADTSNKLTLSVCGKKEKNLPLDKMFIFNPSHVIITDSVSCSFPLGIAMDHD